MATKLDALTLLCITRLINEILVGSARASGMLEALIELDRVVTEYRCTNVRIVTSIGVNI